VTPFQTSISCIHVSLSHFETVVAILRFCRFGLKMRPTLVIFGYLIHLMGSDNNPTNGTFLRGITSCDERSSKLDHRLSGSRDMAFYRKCKIAAVAMLDFIIKFCAYPICRFETVAILRGLASKCVFTPLWGVFGMNLTSRLDTVSTKPSKGTSTGHTGSIDGCTYM